MTRVQEGATIGDRASILRRSEEDKIKSIINLEKGVEDYDINSTMSSELKKGCFDALPKIRQGMVYERFKNAPKEIIEIINLNIEKLNVESTINDECCHFDVNDKIIRMEENLDNEEYAEVFSHEYGHLVDDLKGNFSYSKEFRGSMQRDLEKFDKSTSEGIENFYDMLDDLFLSNAVYDRAISDNLSAFFMNDKDIEFRYCLEGIPYYNHSDDYFFHAGNREAEIYANSFSMLASGTQESCDFMEKYFPEVWDTFRNSL